MSQKVRPKKALGQHFLNDLGIAGKIAGTVSVEETDRLSLNNIPILEIGPGMGVLTQFLLQTGRKIKAVELDSESVRYLEKTMPELDVMEADFLTLNLNDIFDGQQFALIGNYPYNISSQIFFKVLDYKDLIPVASGMLQREVAQRLCSPPGSKAYGILSVLLQTWYDCQYLFTVDENVFTPPPKVKSGVIRIIRNNRQSLDVDENKFRTVVKTAFGQRRKTLRNSLGSIIPADSTLWQKDILKKRPEQLGVEEFIEITRLITENGE